MPLPRRAFLKLGMYGAAGLAVPAAWVPTGTGGYRFRVGAFTCLAIHDEAYVYTAHSFFVNAPPEARAAALSRHHLQPDRIPSPFTCLFVDTGRLRVLIDAGIGTQLGMRGRLGAVLRAEGVEPEQMDTVILTHGHPDHIGGTVDAGGRLCFPNARFVMAPNEWTYWAGEARKSHPSDFGQVARTCLWPVRERLDLVEGGREVVPGVEAVATPGHTPGHLSVALSSEGARLLVLSDAALHPIHVEHPGWHAEYDLDPTAAAASRRRLLDRAAAERALVLAFHFDPFPSLGRIVPQGRSWRWMPEIAGQEATRPR